MYRVLNMDFFSDEIRKGVLKNNDLPDDEEHITNLQVRELSEGLCVPDGDGYLASDEIVEQIMDQATDIVVGFMLSKMAAAGELETAWDSEKNEAVFWLPKGET